MKRWIIRLFAALFPLVAAATELPDPVRFSVRLELDDVAQARAWLDAGLDPNFEGALIGTGLMIGAWSGNIALMELFYSRGADLERTNRFGETALMLAAWKNQREALDWLLARGARPNRPERQWTALHYAAFAGHAAIVETLLERGAEVNARSTNGSTVLMMAAREGHAAIAERLVAAGADPQLKNDFGDDAITWAMRQRNYAIAKSLASVERFASLAREASTNPPPPPVRSQPAPDVVEEYLRMARLAESQGRRDEALASYRKALAELKAQQKPTKAGAGQTAEGAPKALVIRARRDRPEAQIVRFAYAGNDEAGIDELLAAARAAEAAGRRSEALRLFRAAAARIKAGQ